MNYSKQYDILIKQSIGNKHLMRQYAYYDQAYFSKLKEEIAVRNLEYAFGPFEFACLGNERIKMCSVASSSRIGFLYGIQNGIIGFEKTDVRNGICVPHYDNYDELTNTFYEYKCHEFTTDSKSHNRFSHNAEQYAELLRRHFYFDDISNINTNDLFFSFGIQPCMFFDFKQFLCHVLGLFNITSIKNPATLEYVMFVPSNTILNLEKNKEIAQRLDLLETQIHEIFKVMGKKSVRVCNDESGRLEDFIRLSFKYQSVSEVNDFIYSRL